MSNPQRNHSNPGMATLIHVGRNVIRWIRRAIVKHLSISPPHPPALSCIPEALPADLLADTPVRMELQAHACAIPLEMLLYERSYHEATPQLEGTFLFVSRCLHIDPPYPPSPCWCPDALRIDLSARPPALMPQHASIKHKRAAVGMRSLFICLSNTLTCYMHPDHHVMPLCRPTLPLIVGSRAANQTRTRLSRTAGILDTPCLNQASRSQKSVESSIITVVNSFDLHTHSDGSFICVAGPSGGLQAHSTSR